MSYRFLLFVFISAFIAIPPAADAYDVKGRLVVVNSTRADNQFLSDGFCLKPTQCFVLYRSGGSKADIRIRRLSENGALVGRDLVVERGFTEGFLDYVGVKALPGGRFAVLRADADRTYNNMGQQFTIYRISGEKVVKVKSHDLSLKEVWPLTDHGDFAFSRGKFLSVFSQDDRDFPRSEGPDIYGLLRDKSGKPLGKKFLINVERFDAQTEPVVTALSNGNFVVAWWSRNSFVRARVVNGSGKLVGREILVNSTSAPPDRIGRPVVERLTGGRFAIFHHEGTDIYARVYSGTGKLLRRIPITENRSTSAYPFNGFDVVRKDDGGLVVAYVDNNLFQNGKLSYQEFGPGMRRVRGPVLLAENLILNTDIRHLAVAQTSPRTAMVMWTSRENGADDGSGSAVVGISVPTR